jgi:hypothetical protein
VKGYKICRKGFAKNMEPCKPAGLISKNMELCKPAWPNLEKNWHNPIVLTQIRDDNIT